MINKQNKDLVDSRTNLYRRIIIGILWNIETVQKDKYMCVKQVR